MRVFAIILAPAAALRAVAFAQVAQALIDALKARGPPLAFANAGAGARGRCRV